MKEFLNYLIGLLLFLIAYALFLPLSIINYVAVLFKVKSTAKGYFLSSATNLDKYANREFRTLFSVIFIKKNGYQFGNIGETISSVLGKNERDKTLTVAGICLVWLLNRLDRNHCEKSIFEI